LLQSSAGQLIAALLIGLLIGVERGWQSRTDREGHRVAGIRTFGLLGLLGGISGALAISGWKSAAAVMLAACSATIFAGYWRLSRRADQMSATSAVAALLTLGLGAFATFGHSLEAIASACVAALLLASRTQLHGWIAGLSETEIQAGMRFALVAVAVWPLLPSTRFGPFAAWSPRALWGVVVLVTGFSFAGYVASRYFGRNRGTFVTAALGGLYSSTAVIASLSTRLRGTDPGRRAIIAGIAIASAVMFGRVLALTAVLAPRAWPSLALTIAPAPVAALFYAFLTARRAAERADKAVPAEGKNPVELLPALGFAAMVAAMAVGTRWAEQHFGGAGAAAVIVATGSFDVDAAIITLRSLPESALSSWDAGLVLAGPVLLNTLFKAGIVLVNGGQVRWTAAAPLLISAAAIALMLALEIAV
jgi:uncharacterized membrane protein (DUF4010 family)